MEKDHSTPANILMELTHVENPMLVTCLPDNLVAIIGEKDCSLCDYTTNRETEKVCPFTVPYGRIPYLTAHPNGKILALGNYCNGNNENQKKDLIIYDITTKEIWKKKLSIYLQPVFNPIDDTIFIQDYCRKTTVFYYKNKSHEPYSLELSFDKLTLNEFHPTQPNLCLSCNALKVRILTWNNNVFTKGTIVLQLREPVIEECKYSPDGSLIAILTGERICRIFDLQSNSQKILDKNNNYTIWTMVFHPISFILATLSNQPHAICYWNTKTEQLITTTPLPGEPEYYGGNRMDFTGDGGTKLIVVCNNKCLVLETPFKVRYKNITKDNAIFTYWILKNYQQQHGNAIPDEIIHLLINNLLEASQYSFTNY